MGRRQKLKQLGNVFALAPSLHPVPSKVPTGRELHGHSTALFVLAHLRSENPAIAHCHQHGLSSHAKGKCNSNVISKYRHVNSGLKAVKNAGRSPSSIKVPDQVLFTNTGKQSRTPVPPPLPNLLPPYCLPLALPWEWGTGWGWGGGDLV